MNYNFSPFFVDLRIIKLRVLCAAIIIILFSNAFSPVEAKSVHREFSEAWLERGFSYRSQYEEQVIDANDKAEKFITAASAHATSSERSEAAASTAMVESFKTHMDAVRQANYTKGRGLILNDLIDHMRKKPSAQRSEFWMQERVDLLRSKLAVSNEKTKNLEALQNVQFEDPLTKLTTIIKSIQDFQEFSGQVDREQDELNLIDQNLASYHRAFSTEQAKRRAARAAFFGAIGSAMRQQQRRHSNFPSTNTNCTTIGFSTQCTTN